MDVKRVTTPNAGLTVEASKEGQDQDARRRSPRSRGKKEQPAVEKSAPPSLDAESGFEESEISRQILDTESIVSILAVEKTSVASCKTAPTGFPAKKLAKSKLDRKL